MRRRPPGSWGRACETRSTGSARESSTAGVPISTTAWARSSRTVAARSTSTGARFTGGAAPRPPPVAAALVHGPRRVRGRAVARHASERAHVARPPAHDLAGHRGGPRRVCSRAARVSSPSGSWRSSGMRVGVFGNASRTARDAARRIEAQLPVAGFPAASATVAVGCAVVAADDEWCTAIAARQLARYAASDRVAREARET